MKIRAIIALQEIEGKIEAAQLIGWARASDDDLRTQVDEDMEHAGRTPTRYLLLDIAVPEAPPATVMRMEHLR